MEFREFKDICKLTKENNEDFNYSTDKVIIEYDKNYNCSDLRKDYLWIRNIETGEILEKGLSKSEVFISQTRYKNKELVLLIAIGIPVVSATLYLNFDDLNSDQKLINELSIKAKEEFDC